MKRVKTSIHIEASAGRVWSVLTDFDQHPEWNPFIARISGALCEGGKLSVTIRNPGNGGGLTFRPKLVSAIPDRELRWRGKLLMPGLFDGEHFFLLQAADAGTRLVHGEEFTGLVASLLTASKFAEFEAGFNAMNQALKRRCEATSQSFLPRWTENIPDAA